MEEYLSTGEVARILSKSPQWVWQLIKKHKKLTGVKKVGTRYIIPASSVASYIEERTKDRLEKRTKEE